MAREIAPATLAHLLDTDSALALIDVREHGEYNLAHIPGSTSVPRRQLETRMGRLVPFRGCPGRAVRRQWPARGPGRPDAGTHGLYPRGGAGGRRQSLGQPGEADGVGHERAQQGLRREDGGAAPRADHRRGRAGAPPAPRRRAPHRRHAHAGGVPALLHPRGPQRARRRAGPAHSRPRARASRRHGGGELRRAHAQHHRCARAAADGAAQCPELEERDVRLAPGRSGARARRRPRRLARAVARGPRRRRGLRRPRRRGGRRADARCRRPGER